MDTDGHRSEGEESPQCVCAQWARPDTKLSYITNHHPNCPHYNDSLIDVWKVSDGSTFYAVDNLADAEEFKRNDEESGMENLVIIPDRMHREVFQNMPEFEGF